LIVYWAAVHVDYHEPPLTVCRAALFELFWAPFSLVEYHEPVFVVCWAGGMGGFALLRSACFDGLSGSAAFSQRHDWT